MIKHIVYENRKRNKKLKADRYDPIRGYGSCGERRYIQEPETGHLVRIPKLMLKDADYSEEMSLYDFNRLRMKHDFEFWCATCVTVKDKISYHNIKLTLNRPQRIILAQLEAMRVKGQPIRAILLKARQCGASTLIQVYMAWIQLLLRENWNSLICAHVKDVASTIKAMMTKILTYYPAEYLPDGVKKFALTPFEGSRNISKITGRENTITICSAENQEAARGSDIAMAHLSEVAFWRKSPQHDPNDLIRSVAGSMAFSDHSLLVMESTANGIGNFFHDEWLRAMAGESDKVAIFVPWYEYGIYEKPVKKVEEFWNSLDDYERTLWDNGRTLEQIAWYKAKRREYASHRAMKAEYPTTDIEAFTSTDRLVFDSFAVESLRAECRAPRYVGELIADGSKYRDAFSNIKFTPAENGMLKVWAKPDDWPYTHRYVCVVDIGGRSDESDYSVIVVFDRGEEETDRPKIVAQWRGHDDHDLLAWRAAQIAYWYGKALLVIESNTLETEMTEGDNSMFLLDEIDDYYPNLYFRRACDPSSGNTMTHIGFHTNRATKPLIINRLIACVRDKSYRESDDAAINEFAVYERKPNGSYGAKEGYHDDILMTRAIGLYVIDELNRNNGTPIPD